MVNGKVEWGEGKSHGPVQENFSFHWNKQKEAIKMLSIQVTPTIKRKMNDCTAISMQSLLMGIEYIKYCD